MCIPALSCVPYPTTVLERCSGVAEWELGESSDSVAGMQDLSIVPILLSNGMIAFGLNLSVFLLIGKTSALSMNVVGVVKDWCLIGLSVFIFGAQVGASQSPLQRLH